MDPRERVDAIGGFMARETGGQKSTLQYPIISIAW